MVTDASAGAELDLQKELEETERSLREVSLMIEQSQGELSKLTQRNAAITTHLQQVQGQLDKLHHQDCVPPTVCSELTTFVCHAGAIGKVAK
jgi:septal ring factor EnvC (AmiA/AmiB activator)